MNLEKIGSFIKDIRKEKGLTQEQLAEKLGKPEISFSLGNRQDHAGIFTASCHL